MTGLYCDSIIEDCRFPNPEEGKSSLDLSIKFANEKGSSVILANDPDADRFAMAEKNNRWCFFFLLKFKTNHNNKSLFIQDLVNGKFLMETNWVHYLVGGCCGVIKRKIPTFRWIKCI